MIEKTISQIFTLDDFKQSKLHLEDLLYSNPGFAPEGITYDKMLLAGFSVYHCLLLENIIFDDEIINSFHMEKVNNLRSERKILDNKFKSELFHLKEDVKGICKEEIFEGGSEVKNMLKRYKESQNEDIQWMTITSKIINLAEDFTFKDVYELVSKNRFRGVNLSEPVELEEDGFLERLKKPFIR